MKLISCFFCMTLIILLITSCSASVSESSISDNNPDNLDDYLSSNNKIFTTDAAGAADGSSVPSQNSSQLSVEDAYNKYKYALNSFSELSSFSANSEAVIIIPSVAEFNYSYSLSEIRNDGKIYLRSHSTNIAYDNNLQLSGSVISEKYSDGDKILNKVITDSSSREIKSEDIGNGLDDLMLYISSFSKNNIINIDTSSDKDGQKIIFTLDPASMKESVENIINSLEYVDIRMTAYAVTAYINNDGYLANESINISFDYDNGYKLYSGTVQAYTQINDINSKKSIDIPEWVGNQAD